MFFAVCFHVSLESKRKPRYFTVYYVMYKSKFDSLLLLQIHYYYYKIKLFTAFVGEIIYLLQKNIFNEIRLNVLFGNYNFLKYYTSVYTFNSSAWTFNVIRNSLNFFFSKNIISVTNTTIGITLIYFYCLICWISQLIFITLFSVYFDLQEPLLFKICFLFIFID